MIDPRPPSTELRRWGLEDHAVGLELQIVELVERRERALVQGDVTAADGIQREIDALQAELATTAEAIGS